jgi:hypothetical protein
VTKDADDNRTTSTECSAVLLLVAFAALTSASYEPYLQAGQASIEDSGSQEHSLHLETRRMKWRSLGRRRLD